MTTKNRTTEMLFSESRPELSPPISSIEELNSMDSQSVAWWGVGWWQCEAVKQCIKTEELQRQNDALRALLAKTSDEVALNHASRMCQ
jgi:hypothetical protein